MRPFLPKLSISADDEFNDSYEDDDGVTDTERSLDSPIAIPQHLESVKSSVTNYNNVTDGNFGSKFTDDKIKRQFTHFIKGKSALGVNLMYFKNADLDTFTKMFIYNKEPSREPTNILIKILSEVYYHQQFSKLQNSCNFKVPNLISYGFIEHNNDSSIQIRDDEYMFYIKMKDVNAIPVTNLNKLYNQDEVLDKCKTIETEVDRINNCLEEHSLYHNDLQSDNVMINENGDITIIDFGESSNNQQFIYTDKLCNQFKKKGGASKYNRKRNRQSRKRQSRKTKRKQTKKQTKKRPSSQTKKRKLIRKRKQSRKLKK
jgi:hypothetical protein